MANTRERCNPTSRRLRRCYRPLATGTAAAADPNRSLNAERNGRQKKKKKRKEASPSASRLVLSASAIGPKDALADWRRWRALSPGNQRLKARARVQSLREVRSGRGGAVPVSLLRSKDVSLHLPARQTWWFNLAIAGLRCPPAGRTSSGSGGPCSSSHRSSTWGAPLAWSPLAPLYSVLERPLDRRGSVQKLSPGQVGFGMLCGGLCRSDF